MAIQKRSLANKKSKLKRGTVGSSTSSSNNMQDKINNYNTRLAAAGVDAEKETDKRNWLEKALNLEKDQNILFDALELLGRPQNALFTGIANVQDGGNFLEGVKEGISGEEKTSGRDLLVNAGAKDTDFELLDPSTWKDVGIADIAGTALDIFADPLDLAILPAKGATVAGKAAKAADTLNDASKALDVAKAAGKTEDIAKATDALVNARKASELADDALKATSKSLFYNAGKGTTSVSNILGKGTGKVIGKVAGIADTGIEKWLGHLDNKTQKQIQKLIDKGATQEEAIRAIGKSTNKLNTYQDLKKGVSRIFDSSKNVKGLTGASRDAENMSEFIANMAKDDRDNIIERAKDIAKRSGRNADEVYSEIMSNLSNAVEANMDWSLKGSDIINEFKNNKTAELFRPEQAQRVQEALSKYGIDTTQEGTKLTLNSDKNKLYAIADDLDESGLKFSDQIFGKKMDEEIEQALKNSSKYFEGNNELNSLLLDSRNLVQNTAKRTDELTGLNTANRATTDYVKHNRNVDAYRNVEKSMQARKYDMPLAQANKYKSAEAAAEAAAKSETARSAANKIFKTDDNGNFIDKNGTKYALDDTGKFVDESGNKFTRNEINLDRSDEYYKQSLERKKNTISSLEKEVESYKEVLKKETGNALDETKLTAKGQKAVKQIDKITGDQDTLKELNSIKWDNIPDDHIGVIDDVRKDFKEYSKDVTKFKNHAVKKDIDEVGGLFPKDEQLKGMYQSLKISKQKVTLDITVAKNYAKSDAKAAIKNANKAFKEGMSAGKKSEKLMTKLKNNQLSSIYQTANDMVDNLTKRINFEKASLDKTVKNLGESADTFFNKQLRIVDNASQAASVLSDDAAKEFFTSAFDINITEYINMNKKYTTGAATFNDALVKGIFSDPTYVKTIDSLENGVIPYGYKKVSSDYLQKKLNAFEGVLSEEGKRYVSQVSDLLGKDIVMDKELITALDKGSKIISEQKGPLLKLWDGINNTFKKFSTLSLGFQGRNIIGNTTDMVLSGMPASQVLPYYKKATDLWNRSDELVDMFKNGTLEGDDLKQWEILKDFFGAGFSDAYKKGQGFEDLTKKGVLGKVSDWSIKANNNVDMHNRLALMMYAKDNPSFLKGLGVKTPVEAVRKALFDPDNMSDFEKKTLKRIIPFYTFTKQNLMFQADNIMRNTPKYNRLFKGLNSMYNSLDEDSYYQYQKEGMQIPLPWTDDDGNQMFLKANLPISDLGEWLSNPLQRLVSSTSPIIKGPFEAVTGVDTFTGQTANNNAVSGLAEALGAEPSYKTKSTLSKAEALLKGMGMSNVTTKMIKRVSKIMQAYNDDISNQQMWGEIFSSLLQNTNQESVENQRLYNEMNEYAAIVKQLKDQGYDVPTMREINASSKNTLRRMTKRRNRVR